LHKVADRHEADLGTSEPGSRNDGPAAGQPSPIPREAIIVGIDGGYLRNWHDKQKKFEGLVGKSMAEDRDDRYFGLVRSQDVDPKRRFCEMLRRQGLPTDQPVTALAVTAFARSWATCRPALCQEAADTGVEERGPPPPATRTLDGTLHDLFTTWYPAMPGNDVQPLPLAAAV